MSTLSETGEQAAPQREASQTPASFGTIALLGLILVATGAFGYINSLRAPFLFDDVPQIVENHLIRVLWPATYFHGTRGVGNLTFALNYAYGGLDVRGYHAANIAIHLCSGLLLFGLIRRTLLLPPWRTRYQENAHWLAFAVALLWTVHPLQTQSVTYTVQRYESLMGLFFLACLYSLLRGASAKRGWPWYLATILAFYLGMGTKPVMVTAPVVAILYDRIFLGHSWRELLQRRWWVYTAFVAPAILVAPELGRILFTPSKRHAGFALEGTSSLEYLSTQAGVIMHYLRLSFWPKVLCLDYAWPPASTARTIVIPGIIILALLGASFVALKFWPSMGFLGLSFFLILAPTSSIVPIADRAFEHRMYLPLACVLTMAVVAFDRLISRAVVGHKSRKVLFVLTLTVLATALTIRTIRRNRDYLEPIRIWQGAVAVNPNNARAHFSVAMCLRDQGQTEEAIHQIQTALRLNPDYARAHANLALLLAATREPASAIRHFERAVELEPDRARNWYNYGNLFARLGDFAQASIRFRKAAELDPQSADAHQNLGESLYQLGRYEESVPSFRRAIELDPERLQSLRRLAWLLAGGVGEAGFRPAEAVELAEEGERLSRRSGLGPDAEMLDILAAAHASNRHYQRALNYAQRALSLSLNSGDEKLAEGIQSRIDLYQAEQPFRLQGGSEHREVER